MDQYHRVVLTDNYNRDYISERWLNENHYSTKELAEEVAAQYNEHCTSYYAKVVKLPYELYEFEP